MEAMQQTANRLRFTLCVSAIHVLAAQQLTLELSIAHAASTPLDFV
jgi:hypothetical protein